MATLDQIRRGALLHDEKYDYNVTVVKKDGDDVHCWMDWTSCRINVVDLLNMERYRLVRWRSEAEMKRIEINFDPVIFRPQLKLVV